MIAYFITRAHVKIIKPRAGSDARRYAYGNGSERFPAAFAYFTSGFLRLQLSFYAGSHAKYMTADGDKSYISTSNWGPSYFTTTRSAAVLIYGREGARVLDDVFQKVWNGPYVQLLKQDKEYKPVVRDFPKENKEVKDQAKQK